MMMTYIREQLIDIAWPKITLCFDEGGITYIPRAYRFVPLPHGGFRLDLRWWARAVRWALQRRKRPVDAA